MPIIEITEEHSDDKGKKNLSWKTSMDVAVNQLFNYEINDSKARAKFVKGAKLETMKIEYLTNCTIIQLNVGTYKTTILPLMKDLNENKVGINDLKVVDAKQGFDKSGKNVETVVTISDKEKKVILHCHNTNLSQSRRQNYHRICQKYVGPTY